MTDAAPTSTSAAAWAVGIATFSSEGKVLDTWYPDPILGLTEGALRLAEEHDHAGGAATYALTRRQALDYLRVDVQHLTESDDLRRVRRAAVVTFIGDLDDAPVDAHDCYLRLHLLSHRLVKPHGCNLDGIFGLLTNVVWTNVGPCAVEGFEQTRMRLRVAGHAVTVYGIDKFPRMVDYVVPSGVRIADADRVRLGAHLSEGTTVMHEGFCNYNAGTLGSSMDIGGGSSIQGTLAGCNKTVISIGEGCLLGANAGLGISLGDRCTIQAGCYILGGTLVTTPDGQVVKASTLSGQSDLLFRQNSKTGVMEVLSQTVDWGSLNTALHQND